MVVTSSAKPHPKGSIIVTSSSAAFQSSYSDLTYAGVKAAVNGMVKSGAVQLASSQIRVNGIAPGPTNTSILETSVRAESGQTTSSSKKLSHELDLADSGMGDSYYYYNRISAPEDLANVGVFLASDAARTINGVVVLVDNGKTCGAFGEGFTGRIPPVPSLADAIK